MNPYCDPPVPKMGFLSSVIPRQLLPLKVPYSRLGTQVGLSPSGNPRTGPGHYDNEQKTNLTSHIMSHPESTKGYTMGARTAPRLEPGPKQEEDRDHLSEYQDATSLSSDGKTKWPGTYNHVFKRNRKVLWPQSFGGSPVHMPTVTQPSTISRNTAKLSSTKEELKFHRKLAYLKLYYD
ncbi:ciliary microtubule-associated protein 3-like isoform X4 [Babylonia areolata]|uniref:ciliary microtubule-associated protein 3-like isoform X4 n=1 Tax=Babylonia areolata TaxID=304850 RepID=UPI003FD66619